MKDNKILSDVEMVKLRMALEDRPFVRDKVIVYLLFDTELRLRELCELKVEDVELNEQNLVVHRRLSTTIVSFGEVCRFYLRNYLNQHPTKKGALFLSKDNKPLTPQFIYWLVSNLGKRAGLKITPNDLRRRYLFQNSLIGRIDINQLT